MEPSLSDGDTVLVDHRAEAVEGDIVVARHPWEDASVLKRVDHITDLRGVASRTPASPHRPRADVEVREPSGDIYSFGTLA